MRGARNFVAHYIEILQEEDEEGAWWWGQHDGKVGWFPSSFVEELRDAPVAPAGPTRSVAPRSVSMQSVETEDVPPSHTRRGEGVVRV